jgi:hypothetical protein
LCTGCFSKNGLRARDEKAGNLRRNS